MNSKLISRSVLYCFGAAVVAMIIYVIIALATGGKLTSSETISTGLFTGGITFVISFVLSIFFTWLGTRKRAS